MQGPGATAEYAVHQCLVVFVAAAILGSEYHQQARRGPSDGTLQRSTALQLSTSHWAAGSSTRTMRLLLLFCVL